MTDFIQDGINQANAWIADRVIEPVSEFGAVCENSGKGAFTCAPNDCVCDCFEFTKPTVVAPTPVVVVKCAPVAKIVPEPTILNSNAKVYEFYDNVCCLSDILGDYCSYEECVGNSNYGNTKPLRALRKLIAEELNWDEQSLYETPRKYVYHHQLDEYNRLRDRVNFIAKCVLRWHFA